MWMCPDLDGFRTYIKYPTYKCEGPCCTTPPFQPQDLEQTCESPIPRFGYPPVEDHGQSWPWLGHPQPWSFQHKIPCKLRCYSIFISGNGGFSSHIWWQMDTFFGIKLNRDGKSRGNQMKDPTSETSPQFVCDSRHENIKTGGFNHAGTSRFLATCECFNPSQSPLGFRIEHT